MFSIAVYVYSRFNKKHVRAARLETIAVKSKK